MLERGDGIGAGHDGKHGVLLHRLVSVGMEPMLFEMVLMKAGYNDRIGIAGSVIGVDGLFPAARADTLRAQESGRGNR